MLMVLTRKEIPLLLLLALFLTGPVTAEFESESLPEKLATPVKNFLEADTAAARAGMAAFSDEDLQKIVNAFKKSHSSADQRLFWLIEESYRRNAERVAAERIRYLYYAVLAALGIIGLFAALTYARARVLPTPRTQSVPQAPSPNAGRGAESPPPYTGEVGRGRQRKTGKKGKK